MAMVFDLRLHGRGGHAVTNETLIEAFLDNLRLRGLSERTVERRQSTLKLFCAWADLPLAHAALDDIEGFLATRRAASTRRAYLGDLKAFYSWATKRGHIDHDPTALIDQPKVPRRAPTPLSDLDVRRLLAAVPPGSRVERIVYLGLFAGLRTSEMAALHTDDIDHDTGILIVRRGKGGSDAILPLAPRLAAVLKPLPPGPVVGYAHRVDVSACVKRLYRQLGITARAHDLRHTFGTTAARASNGNVLAVRDLMRHSSVATTQAYIGWSPNTTDLIASMYQPAE
jgi:integrase/recombinase XerD